MHSEWRRRVRTLVLLLLAGLLISIGVALACDRARNSATGISVGTVEAHGRTWVLSRRRGWGLDGVGLDTYGPQRPSAAEDIVRFHRSLSGASEPAVLPWWVSVPDIAPCPGQDTDFEVARVARGGCGFPFPCLFRGSDTVTYADGTTLSEVGLFPWRFYPWGFWIVPAGLALDTVAYAAPLVTIWLGWGMVIRAIRRRGGRCTSCGYSRQGLAIATPCPECGKPAK